MRKIFRSIYFQAFVFWVFYSVGTKALFVFAVVWKSSAIALGIMGTVAVIFGIVFLYLFSHEEFFKFAKIIEKWEMKTERKWLKRFIDSGKVVTTLLIGLLLGPMFAALTASLLLARKPYKYYLVGIVSFISSVILLAGARGVISLFD